jgi:hypothetical protein
LTILFASERRDETTLLWPVSRHCLPWSSSSSIFFGQVSSGVSCAGRLHHLFAPSSSRYQSVRRPEKPRTDRTRPHPWQRRQRTETSGWGARDLPGRPMPAGDGRIRRAQNDLRPDLRCRASRLGTQPACACAPNIAAQKAALVASEARRAGLLESIKRKRRDMQETAKEETAQKELIPHPSGSLGGIPTST